MEPTACQPAVFASIENVAKVERLRMFGPEPEPVDVQISRYEAAEEARRVVAEAYQVADSVRAEAERTGYEAGWAQGYLEGKAAAEAAVQAEDERFRADYRDELDFLLRALAEETRELWLNAEPQIVAFAVEIARKVVKDETAVNPDIVVDLVRNALRRVVDSETLRIRVNAADLDTVRNARSDIVAVIDGVRNVEIVEDRRVARGGCVVETASGTIDANIETQFRMIEETLGGVRDEVEAELRSSEFRVRSSEASGLETPTEIGRAA